MVKQTEQKLYPCCNTCKHKLNNFYQCDIPDKCFNGFSAYEPNDKMQQFSFKNKFKNK